MKKKILITGIEGFLGANLARTYDSAKFEISGTYFLGNKPAIPGIETQYADITDVINTNNVLNNIDPDIIIHTAGVSNVDQAEKDPMHSYNTTVIGTYNIAEWCRARQKQLIYSSTNAIFWGDKAPYDESSLPLPINKYGKHKFIAESIVRNLKSFLIFRLILMYGWNYETRNNPVTSVIQSLRKGEVLNMVKGYSFINPLFIKSCCNAIWTAVDKETDKEIYHIAGADIVDRYELAIITAEVFDLDKQLIKPVDDTFYSCLAKRPFNTSYSTKKAEKDLGFRPLSLREGLILMKNTEG